MFSLCNVYYDPSGSQRKIYCLESHVCMRCWNRSCLYKFMGCIIMIIWGAYLFFGLYESMRFIWFTVIYILIWGVHMDMVPMAVSGFLMCMWCIWFCVVYMVVCGVYGYVWCIWLCVVYMVMCGVYGYVWCIWLCVVYMVMCSAYGYVWCIWLCVVYMVICGVYGSV